MVKPVNTAMAYMGMRAATLASVATSRAIEAAGEQEDAVGEHQPVAPDGELAGQERVLGHEADQEGEAGEAGVGGQDEDQRRGRLQRVEEDLAAGARPVDELADLGQDRGTSQGVGHGVAEGGQHRHAQEHRAQDACS